MELQYLNILSIIQTYIKYNIMNFIYLKYLECSTKIAKLLPPYILQV